MAHLLRDLVLDAIYDPDGEGETERYVITVIILFNVNRHSVLLGYNHRDCLPINYDIVDLKTEKCDCKPSYIVENEHL